MCTLLGPQLLLGFKLNGLTRKRPTLFAKTRLEGRITQLDLNLAIQVTLTILYTQSCCFVDFNNIHVSKISDIF